MLYFKEVLPNPMGRDPNGEWIKLINTGKTAVNTGGWTLSDQSGKTFHFSNIPISQQSIMPGGELTLKYSQTKIILNNGGDTLYLYDKTKKLIDKLAYTGQVSEDEVIIAQQFIKTTEIHTAISAESIENLSVDQVNFVSGQINTSPLLISIILAVLSGIFGGIIVKEIKNKQ